MSKSRPRNTVQGAPSGRPSLRRRQNGVQSDRNRVPASTSDPRGELETEAQATAEDALRAKGLRLVIAGLGPKTPESRAERLKLKKVRHQHLELPTIDLEKAEDLQHRLQDGVDTGTPPPTPASSLYMLGVRERCLSLLNLALAEHDSDDLRAFTVIYRGWALTPNELQDSTAAAIKNQFRTHLIRAGVFQTPGLFIAFIHGEFEPTSGTYQLHFHGVTTAAKAKALRGLLQIGGYVKTASGAASVHTSKIRSERQKSYPLKSFWPERGIRETEQGPKRDRQGQRIHEPHHTQVLLWLDAQKLGDLVLMNDCWSPRKGGREAMRDLYLLFFGRG